MAFEKTEQVLADAKKLAKEAEGLCVKTNDLASSANASFKFEDNDKLVIDEQLAHLVKLSPEMIASAKKGAKNPDAVPQAYWAFDATVVRGSEKLPCQVTAKQLYTPTIWLSAESLGSHEINEKEIEIFNAPFNQSVKRFGENGAMTLVEGCPAITNKIERKITVGDVYISIFATKEERAEIFGDTEDSGSLLVARKDYGYVE